MQDAIGELLMGERFGNEIERAFAHRRDGGVHRRRASDDDGAGGRLMPLEHRQKRRAFAVRQIHVRDEQLNRLAEP